MAIEAKKKKITLTFNALKRKLKSYWEKEKMNYVFAVRYS